MADYPTPQFTISVDDMGVVPTLVRLLSSIKGIRFQPLPYSQEAHEQAARQAVPLAFPHIPRNRQRSPEVEKMVAGQLPEDFDLGKEIAEMWEEMAK